MQERDEVFAFAQKPSVRSVGSAGSVRYEIAFATTAACDATVAILDKEGKIVRHLASGVLGTNAPYPFAQGTLRQAIVWDGLSDDFKPVTNAARVKVSLGLRAKYERSIGYNPASIPDPKNVLVGTGPDGLVIVAANAPRWDTGCVAFDRDGKYVKTIIPPSGADMERAAAAMGKKLSTTKWGDKVMVSDWFGPFSELNASNVVARLIPGVELKPGPAPTNLVGTGATGVGAWGGKIAHLAADRTRDEIYAGPGGQARFFGKTGVLDTNWFPDPKSNLGGGASCGEVSVGPDGLVYLRFGPSLYGRHMIRLNHEGKLAPFKPEHQVKVSGGEGWWERLPSAFRGGVDAVYCGVAGHSFTHQSGLYAAPNRLIVMGIHEVSAKWAAEQGIVAQGQSGGGEIRGNYIPVFDRDGKLLTANAVGETSMGQGVTMDRDGNIYAVFGGLAPDDQPTMDGSDLKAPLYRAQGGSGALVKFRGRGGQFPLNQGGRVMKLRPPHGKPGETSGGALWAYGGMSGQSGGDCQCHQIRHDMDFFARSFIPSMALYSVVVLDANMNRVARFGRYGNPDDGEADIRSGKGDGIRIGWSRAVAVSDDALYVQDPANRRILRAELSYAAEVTMVLN